MTTILQLVPANCIVTWLLSRNYLPKQTPTLLQTHFYLLYCNLPKNSVPTPFRITVVSLSLFCYSPFHNGTAFSSDGL